jgi:uncharacterized ion transporter superfamily protein YfcC
MKKWYEYIPHPVIILFGMLVLAWLFTYLVPAGEFDRVEIDGKMKVVEGSFHYVEAAKLSPAFIFQSMPKGYKAAIDVIFIIVASGIMFGVLNATGTVENVVGSFVKSLGKNNQNFLIAGMTFVYGLLGIFIGYENNIAMIPIAAVISLAIGGDLVLATGIAVGGITVGFGLSPFNPYTVGTAQRIAELPLFSGAFLRIILCVLGLTVMAYYNISYFRKTQASPDKGLGLGLDSSGFSLSKSIQDFKMHGKDWLVLSSFALMLIIMIYGVFEFKWYLNDMSALFLILAFVLMFFLKKTNLERGELLLDSVAKVAPGAFMVGFAASIRIVLEEGKVSDSITFYLANLLEGMPNYLSATGMVLTQSLMNFMIPSGSGQALATMPILVPLGEMLQLTKQTVVLAFQVGDGVSNLINPAFGGLVAMIAICRVPFGRWLRFIAPVVAILIALTIVFVIISVMINYGPA